VGSLDSGVGSCRALPGGAADGAGGAGIAKIVAHLGHLIFFPDVAGAEVLSAAAHFGQAKVMTDMAWLSQLVVALTQETSEVLETSEVFPETVWQFQTHDATRIRRGV
jgi:hypothetical protein